jgi:ubiquinone/menaquinone biosynthesis C-methylase UbiE
VSAKSEVKRQVREFYDRVGWQQVSQGTYQNAHYDDLRPVSQEYIHNCHLRVLRHLHPEGRYLLDAGSGPIQYPEYLEYSHGYEKRVCADISIVALQEARQRLGENGWYVVCDVANLPFSPQIFDGVVSLHTIHHLPAEEHLQAYDELYRVLTPDRQAVVVNGWSSAALSTVLNAPLRLQKFIRRLYRRLHGNLPTEQKPKGTYVRKNTAATLREALEGRMNFEIFVWRSVSVNWMRQFIHPAWGGKTILRWLYLLEERFPHFFGAYGQYPLIVIRKPKPETIGVSLDAGSE